MSGTLLAKVWDAHTVCELPTGETQLFVGLHLVHEVSSPQAFGMLRALGLGVRWPKRTIATLDHIVPTDAVSRPYSDVAIEEMASTLEQNCRAHGIRLLDPSSGKQGIVHVIAPELGLTQPGMTIVCGDSHTSTHGALGALAFGIGTTQIRDVLASQCVSVRRPKTRRIEITGRLGGGVYAKDLILATIRRLGVKAGAGYAHEFAGPVVDALSIEQRMTLCNMAIEGGARMAYVNPDDTTFAYLRGRECAPTGSAFDEAVTWWRSFASDANASFDDRVTIPGESIVPTVTWGINPGQSVGVDEPIPNPEALRPEDRPAIVEALNYMGLRPGLPVLGLRVDLAFIGSCTNGRISDLREAARVAGSGHVAQGTRALVVPGSQSVARQAEAEGLDDVFVAAGFEWRRPGCSMCIAMNGDALVGRQVCASTSNRNFKGRQGSPTGRTLLMSPAMVAAAALRGRVTDVREVL